MKVYLDEHIHLTMASLLRARGVDCITTRSNKRGRESLCAGSAPSDTRHQIRRGEEYLVKRPETKYASRMPFQRLRTFHEG